MLAARANLSHWRLGVASPPRCAFPAPRTCSACIRRSVRRAAASPRAGIYTRRVAGRGDAPAPGLLLPALEALEFVSLFEPS